MNKIIFSLLILFQLTAVAQSRLFSQVYDEFSDFGMNEAELEIHESEGELIVFNEAKHNTRLAKTLFKNKTGKKHKEKTRTGDRVYEVLAERHVKHYRINYIFLDGERMSIDAIMRLREKMQGMLDEGIKFTSIARQYSMDRNSHNGGDSGWFKQERTVPEFFEAINDSKLLANMVYTVDLPEANWYYLVQKTYSPKEIREVLVKITD